MVFCPNAHRDKSSSSSSMILPHRTVVWWHLADKQANKQVSKQLVRKALYFIWKEKAKWKAIQLLSNQTTTTAITTSATKPLSLSHHHYDDDQPGISLRSQLFFRLTFVLLSVAYFFRHSPDIHSMINRAGIVLFLDDCWVMLRGGVTVFISNLLSTTKTSLHFARAECVCFFLSSPRVT